MKKFVMAAMLKTLCILLALGLCVLSLSGCATVDNNDDSGSDLPWNTPQPWESAPSIHGLDGMGG